MIADCGQRHLADLCLLRNVRVEGWSRINARATLTTYNNLSSTNSTLCAQPCYCQTVETHSCVSANRQSFASGDFIQPSCLLRRKNASLHFDNNRLYEYPQFPQQEIRSIFMVSFRLQSILASMAKYYWILHYLSLLLSRLKHSFICKGVIGQNADIHYRLCAQDEIRRTHVSILLHFTSWNRLFF